MIKEFNQLFHDIYNVYQKIKYPTVLTVLVMMSCLFTLHELKGQISLVERVIIYTLTYLGTQHINKIITWVAESFVNWFDKLILLFICLITTFCETGSYYLETRDNIVFSKTVFFLLSFLWISVIVLFLMYCVGQLLRKKRNICGTEFSMKSKVIMTVICLSVCILSNYSFNPAITSRDSQYCFNYAIHLGESPILDGHPVFYLLLLRLLLKFCPRISFLIVAQGFYYTVIIVYVINTLAQMGVSKRICVVLFVFIGMGFNSIIQVSTLWKDIPYTISLVWLTLLLVKKCLWQQKMVNEWCWYAQYIVATVFTALIRHNGLLPGVFTLLLGLIFFKDKKRMIITTFFSVLLIMMIKGPIYNSFQVETVPGLKFYAMANDIMYLYYQGEHDDRIIQVVNDMTDGHPEEFEYSPHYTMLTSESRSNMNHYSVWGFMKIYIHAWIQHPQMMLKAFLLRNTVIWSIDRAPYEQVNCVNYLGEYHDSFSFQEQYPDRKPNFFTVLFTSLFKKLTSYKFVYTLYWKTAIYNLLMLIGIMLIIIRYKWDFIYVGLPFVPIVTNVFCLLVSSGWTDYRYYWPSMMTALILIPYSVVVLFREEDSIKTR